MKTTFVDELLRGVKEAPRLYFVPLIGAVKEIRAELRRIEAATTRVDDDRLRGIVSETYATGSPTSLHFHFDLRFKLLNLFIQHLEVLDQSLNKLTERDWQLISRAFDYAWESRSNVGDSLRHN